MPGFPRTLSTGTNDPSSTTVKRLLLKLKGLRLPHGADVLREAAIRLLALRETLELNDEGYAELIQRVAILTDGVLKRATEGEVSRREEDPEDSDEDDELAMLAKVVDEIASYTENFQTPRGVRPPSGEETSKQLARYNKLLDDVYSRVQLGVGLDIRKSLKKLHIMNSNPNSPEARSPTIVIPKDLPIVELPPKPMFHVYGRDAQLKIAREAIVHFPSAPIAVLGGGGMGKTTFAVTLLHDEDVVAAFGPNRVFVSCDGVTTADGIVTSLLNLLRISAPDGVTGLQALVLFLSSLQPRVLVVLDNLGSAWDTLQRESIETFLTNLCHIQTLALMITMRGTRTPNGQRWLSFAPLDKLSAGDSRSLFVDISGTSDDSLDELLGYLDGLPLAVTLMASLGRDTTGNINTPTKLLQSYLTEQTSMLQTGTDTRLSSLDVSIKVSINCRTMQENSDALELLKLVSLLPDGVRDEDLQSTFPDLRRCTAAIRILHVVALAKYREGVTRVLAPIRAFVQANYPLAGPHLATMRAHYIQLASSSEAYPDVRQTLVDTLSKQMSNLQSVLTHALGSISDPVALLVAIRNVSRFSYVAYVGDCTLVLRQAIRTYSFKPESSSQHNSRGLASAASEQTMDLDLRHGVAECLLLLGVTQARRHEYDEAIQALNKARTEFKKIGDGLGVARCLRDLADIPRLQGEYDEAAKLINEAKNAYSEIQDRRGVADCLWSLADIMRMQDEYRQAAVLIKEVKATYMDINDLWGVADCLRTLGDILRVQGEYDQAVNLINEAKAIFAEIGNRLGVAQCLWSLGDILRMQDEYGLATVLLDQARLAYTNIGDRMGVADCLRTLGDILRMEGDYEEAGRLILEAQAEYAYIGVRSGLAECAVSLAQTRLSQGELDQASTLFGQAQTLFNSLKLVASADWCREQLDELTERRAGRQNGPHGRRLSRSAQPARRFRTPRWLRIPRARARHYSRFIA